MTRCFYCDNKVPTYDVQDALGECYVKDDGTEIPPPPKANVTMYNRSIMNKPDWTYERFTLVCVGLIIIIAVVAALFWW